jgi:ribA/ribD-fused uncharacterized protein
MITSFSKDYHFLSNFFPHEFFFQGYVCWSSEHAYQMSKCVHDSERHEILRAKSPAVAKHLGRTIQLRENWSHLCDQIMYEIVFIKFSDVLKSSLLSTGDQTLIEGNTWGDKYWGSVYNHKTKEWQGQNRLGQILMRVRSEFHESRDV